MPQTLTATSIFLRMQNATRQPAPEIDYLGELQAIIDGKLPNHARELVERGLAVHGPEGFSLTKIGERSYRYLMATRDW